MHLFFAITKIGIGNAFGEPFWIVLKSFFCMLQPEKDAFATGSTAFQSLATRAWKNPWGSMVNGIPKWNYAPKGFRLQWITPLR
jgi:hypothetical protein